MLMLLAMSAATLLCHLLLLLLLINTRPLLVGIDVLQFAAAGPVRVLCSLLASTACALQLLFAAGQTVVLLLGVCTAMPQLVAYRRMRRRWLDRSTVGSCSSMPSLCQHALPSRPTKSRLFNATARLYKLLLLLLFL